MTARAFMRVIAWNVLLVFGVLGLLALAGEAWLRTTRPFGAETQPHLFWPGLGRHYAPNSAVRVITSDFMARSHTNSHGFLDREPPSRQAARASCHVAVVGDSFTVADSQPNASKFHVVLERMAARRTPALDITTTAWALGGVGQVHQLVYWDKWLRHWSPRLIVLVAVANDLGENRRTPPNRNFFTVGPPGDGQQMRLAHPYFDDMPVDQSILFDLLHAFPPDRRPWFVSWARRKLNPRRADPIMPVDSLRLPAELARYTAWALDQWQERTAQAGASLVVLASTTMHDWPQWTRGTWRMLGNVPAYHHFKEMTEERSIPLVDQLAYVNANSDASHFDLHWPTDNHWNSTGHRWAAETLLDYVARNPQVCAV